MVPAFCTASCRAPSRPRTRAGHAVPDHARAQLGELVGGVAAREHVEHALELLARRARRRGRRPGPGPGARPRAAARRRGGDDLLGQDVQRQPGDAGLLDRALAHARDHGRALEQVAPVLGEDAPAAGGVDLVAGAADALDAPGHAARALDLDDQVDGAHVDAELQAAGGHQAGQAPGLELLLDQQALLAGQAAVVGAGHLLLGQLVEAQGEALGQAAVVDEDDRRAVGPHQLEDLRVHRRPDRAPGALGARQLDGVVADRRRRVGQLAHVLDRDPDLQVELLGAAGVDHRHRPRAGPRRPGRPGSGRSRTAGAAWPTGRSAGRRRPASRSSRSRLRARWAPRLVAATAWISSTMIEPGALEDRRAARGEEQVQALRGGDEDVRRLAEHPRTLGLGGVARADGDRERRQLDAPARRGVGQAVERGAQVALDVVVQRLERRDVQQPGAGLAAQPLLDQPVEAPEEGGQRLARAGGGQDQRVLAARDGRPALEPAAGVGAAKARSNQSATSGWNGAAAARAGAVVIEPVMVPPTPAAGPPGPSTTTRRRVPRARGGGAGPRG